MKKFVEVKIPAKIMLFGEYHVLNSGVSLTVTPDLYMTVKVSSGTAGSLKLSSDLWKNSKIHSGNLSSYNPLLKPKNRHLSLFELTALNAFSALPLDSAAIDITSGWRVSDGLGSSSALRLGVWFGLYSLSQPEEGLSQPTLSDHHLKILRDIWEDQKRHQGFASGYDLASQYLGGLVSFSYSDSIWPLTLRREICQKDLFGQFIHVFVGGKGAPTGATGKAHIRWMREQNLTQSWNDIQERGVTQMRQFLAGQQAYEIFPELLRTFQNAMELMKKSPIFPAHIANILYGVSGLGKHWSWKTTGAGGEDAIILFGKEDHCQEAMEKLQQNGWKKLRFSCPDRGIEIQWKQQRESA